MAEVYRGERLTALTVVLALGLVGCGGAEREHDGSTSGEVIAASVWCEGGLPDVGKPQGRGKDDGPWAYQMPADAGCDVPVADPQTGEIIGAIEPGRHFFVDCLAAGQQWQLGVTLTGDTLGASGRVDVSDEAVPSFATGEYQPPDCLPSS